MPRPILATYRVQLRAEFGFDDAAAQADYLAALGVSHLYCSPCLQARAGSQHGYDVVDPTQVSEQLGGGAAYDRLWRRLSEHGLGQVLDLVPNHMATAPENRWWWDVLEHGPASRYAGCFDVDWQSPVAKLRNRVLVPVLPDHYGRALAAGTVRLARTRDAIVVRTGDQTLPAWLPSLSAVLRHAADECPGNVLAALVDRVEALDISSADWRQTYDAVRADLARLWNEDAAVAAAIEAALAAASADLEALDTVLERQHYRLAYWRAAPRELVYRRFFDINSLVAVRVEEPGVFEQMHALVVRWLADDRLDGLRVDHPDGLRDPETYLRRLRGHAEDRWIVVEKILMPGEALRDWPVDGTTGYDFLQRVGALFVDPAGAPALTACWADFTGEPVDFPALARELKHLVLRDAFATDLDRLTGVLVEVCERHWRFRDYTRHELRTAVAELIACWPTYRSYVRSDDRHVEAADDAQVARAIEAAAAARPDIDAALLELLADLLLLRLGGELEGEFAMRFQQLSGPVMAKGVEDTAFYRFNRLVSLNEVGGDPLQMGCDVDAFHDANRAAQARWPRAMLATATHDTKRGEDVRARLHLLSEIPAQWRAAVERWSALTARHRRGDSPDRNMEYLLYQTLVGAWPLDAERACAYMEKAAREAKARTSWTDPNAAYEDGLREFTRAIVADAAFSGDLAAFVAPLVWPGRVTSLAQTLLKLTAPGIPDLYQGTELWDLSLVDPDNRRPVDYERRRALLASLAETSSEAVLRGADDGLPKLWVIRQALAVRRDHADCFGADGAYAPLAAHGARAAHCVAFTRRGDVITVVPRLVLGLGGDWGDTALTLPDGAWRNVFGGDEILGGRQALGALLARFPVALLVRA